MSTLQVHIRIVPESEMVVVVVVVVVFFIGCGELKAFITTERSEKMIGSPAIL